MEENTQTNEQIESTEQVEAVAPEMVSKADYDALKAQLDELQTKLPQEPTEQQRELIQLKRELFESNVKSTLSEYGFQQFAPLLIHVQDTDELNSSIELLQEIYKQDKINNSYVPSGATSTTEYEQAQQKKDVGSMLSAKFSKLFTK